jgi:hypothetical protein
LRTGDLDPKERSMTPVPICNDDQVEVAARAVATAALAVIDPVLLFSAADLSQVGACEAHDLITCRPGQIAVTPPRYFSDPDHLADLSAHRLRRALLMAGRGDLSMIGIPDLLGAVQALVAASYRRAMPGDFVALGEALREIDLGTYTSAVVSVGTIYWISLAGIGGGWALARSEARRRIEDALAGGPSDLASAARTGLRPVGAAPPRIPAQALAA